MDIKIRHIEESDYIDFHEIFGQDSVVSNSTQLPFPCLENVKQKTKPLDDSSLALVATLDDKVIGYVAVFGSTRPRLKHVGDIALVINEEAQGKGIGKLLMNTVINAADDWLNIVRLELEVSTTNNRAIGLYKKCGFEIEGELKYNLFTKGKYTHSYKMARICPNFNQQDD